MSEVQLLLSGYFAMTLSFLAPIRFPSRSTVTATFHVPPIDSAPVPRYLP